MGQGGGGGGTTGDGPGERPTKTKPVKPPATTGSSKTDTSFLAAESLCILAFSLAAFSEPNTVEKMK